MSVPASFFGGAAAICLIVVTSHSLSVLSGGFNPFALCPEASVLPSGLYATECITFVGPLRVARSLPVATSQSLIVLSPAPEANVLPSGLNATESTHSGCPLRVARSLGSCADSGTSGSSPRQVAHSHRDICWLRLIFVVM